MALRIVEEYFTEVMFSLVLNGFNLANVGTPGKRLPEQNRGLPSRKRFLKFGETHLPPDFSAFLFLLFPWLFYNFSFIRW